MTSSELAQKLWSGLGKGNETPPLSWRGTEGTLKRFENLTEQIKVTLEDLKFWPDLDLKGRLLIVIP